MATHSSILTLRTHEQRSLAGYSPWGPKELDTPEKLTRSLSFLSCYGIGILQLLRFSASCLSSLVT